MSDLEHLHRTLLLIMDELDRVCRENEIKYTITGGSMLGAVRHKGFIPWDDDMDIALTRENYEKLMLCADRFNSNFFLQNYTTDPNYFYGYAKLLLKGTETIEFGHEKTKYKKGIFIDIFPLDNVPVDIKLRNKQKKYNYFLQKILRQKMCISDNPSWGIKERFTFKLLRAVSIFLNGEKLIKQLDSNMKMSEHCDSQIITNLCGMYGYEREMANKEWFSEYEDICFEDREYLVIKDRVAYLSKIYGDFMQLPPVDKRHTHEFQTLKFGQH